MRKHPLEPALYIGSNSTIQISIIYANLAPYSSTIE